MKYKNCHENKTSLPTDADKWRLEVRVCNNHNYQNKLLKLKMSTNKLSKNASKVISKLQN